MASLSRTKSKAKSKDRQRDGWTIQFFQLDDAGERHRHSIRIGPMPKSTAQGIRTKIEALVAAKAARQSWDLETADWVGKIDPALHRKIASVGLVPPREEVAPRPKSAMGPFLDAYINGRVSVKGATSIAYSQVRRCLVAYFGADKPMQDITAGDAETWRAWLARPKADDGQGLAENTARRRCGIARQFFRAAIKHRLLTENPFSDMEDGVAVRANRSRDYFLSRQDAARVLAACPDAQWKLIFSLSRYGGLRCPSEHLALRWGDVNWEDGRLTVHSPKTEHHGEEHASRVIPLFEELRPHLQAVLDEVLADEDFDPQETPLSKLPIITRYRGANANLRTQFERIIRRAGLTPWPKLFHNLRATRQTELAESFPSHVVCAWIGNSQAVAQKHYLQVTDEHFAKAAPAGQGMQIALQSAADLKDTSGLDKTNELEMAGACGIPGDLGGRELARKDSNLK